MGHLPRNQFIAGRRWECMNELPYIVWLIVDTPTAPARYPTCLAKVVVYVARGFPELEKATNRPGLKGEGYPGQIGFVIGLEMLVK
ncbi:MAG: hypothetical protein GY743_06670 [Planctomycetaceae bacterium]|nr:hypothetical protein [Planctomycetaceae bacterium]